MYSSVSSSMWLVRGAMLCMRMGFAQDDVCAARLFIRVLSGCDVCDEYSKLFYSAGCPVLGLDFLCKCFESLSRLWLVVERNTPVMGLLNCFTTSLLVRVAQD